MQNVDQAINVVRRSSETSPDLGASVSFAAGQRGDATKELGDVEISARGVAAVKPWPEVLVSTFELRVFRQTDVARELRVLGQTDFARRQSFGQNTFQGTRKCRISHTSGGSAAYLSHKFSTQS